MEGSHDGAQWRQLITDAIFKMSGGAENLGLSFPAGVWEFLRLTIDDSRTTAVPFTDVQLQVVKTKAPVELMDRGVLIRRNAIVKFIAPRSIASRVAPRLSSCD